MYSFHSEKNGADAVREDAARHRAIYPRMLAGELSPRKTGQELVETADSVIALVATEMNWRGFPRPHSVFTTPTGAMFGLDLYDRTLVKSPTVIVTAASGEGESFLATMLITDIRAHRGQVKVRVMDYRYSFKPICLLFGGRHIEFDETDPKPINIWNYPGIENGNLPTKRQLAMVLTDILILSKMPKTDAVTSAIAATVIDDVYKMAAARNGANRPKFQPVLGHFLHVLKSYHWFDAQKARADELYLKLNIYRKDPWLNAPTHTDYDTNSMFDVFELSTVSNLDEKARESVGYSISAQIMQEIGEQDDAGQKTPILFICDEVREINKHFPAIQELMAESLRARKILEFENYGSLLRTVSDWRELAKIIRSAINCEFHDYVRKQKSAVAGLPGFRLYRAGRVQLWTEKDYACPLMLIPYRDEDGFIQACQIRFMCRRMSTEDSPLLSGSLRRTKAAAQAAARLCISQNVNQLSPLNSFSLRKAHSKPKPRKFSNPILTSSRRAA